METPFKHHLSVWNLKDLTTKAVIPTCGEEEGAHAHVAADRGSGKHVMGKSTTEVDPCWRFKRMRKTDISLGVTQKWRFRSGRWGSPVAVAGTSLKNIRMEERVVGRWCRHSIYTRARDTFVPSQVGAVHRFLKCGLIRPKDTFPLCVSPYPMSSGPESLIFLDAVDTNWRTSPCPCF